MNTTMRSVALPAEQWLLIYDLCRVARETFEPDDPTDLTQQERFTTALYAIQTEVLTAVPEVRDLLYLDWADTTDPGLMH